MMVQNMGVTSETADVDEANFGGNSVVHSLLLTN